MALNLLAPQNDDDISTISRGAATPPETVTPDFFDDQDPLGAAEPGKYLVPS